MSLTSLLKTAKNLLAQQVNKSSHNLAMGEKEKEKKQTFRQIVLKIVRLNGYFQTFVRCYLKLNHTETRFYNHSFFPGCNMW